MESAASLFVFSAFLLMLILRFQTGFVVMMAFSVLLQQMALVPGKIRIFEALSICSTIIFLVKTPLQIDTIKKFPLKISFLLLLIVPFVSNHFSSEKHYPTIAVYITTNLLNVYIFWHIIKSNANIYVPIFIKSILVLAGAIAFCSALETLMNFNPYINFVNDIKLYADKTVVSEIRYGLKRAQSLFSMHTTSGGVSLALFCTLLYVQLNTHLLKSSRFASIVIPSLIASILLTGARSAMIGTLVACLMFKRHFFTKKWVRIGIPLIALVLFVFGGYFGEIMKSISNSNRVDGSNAEMRSIQYAIAFSYLDQSPWFGNGISYTWTTALPENEQLYGAESMWIPILIDIGILGALSYAIYFSSIFLYLRREKMQIIAFFMTGFAIFNTMSSIPDFSIITLFVYIFIIIEAQKLTTNSNPPIVSIDLEKTAR